LTTRGSLLQSRSELSIESKPPTGEDNELAGVENSKDMQQK